MTITDGGIMFIGCVLSFLIGYVVGVIRISRYVNKQLDEIKVGVLRIEERSRELQQIYSAIPDADKKG